MSKMYRYGLLFLVFVFLGYNSVYFEKLSEVRAQEEVAFDFEAFADSLYYQGMVKQVDAVELPTLLAAIQTDAGAAFEQYGNRLGIGNSAYFMVQCTGTITDITDDQIRLSTEDAGTVSINTKYIFGNALRDASGLVKLTDFKTNAAFNRVSEALNTLVREKVIPPVIAELQPGDRVAVTGAIKLSKKALEDPALVLTPSVIGPG